MKFFITGATGYIGGSIASQLIADGHQVQGLVRTAARATQAAAYGIEPVVGTLDDTDVLAGASRNADAVINTANADHRGAVLAILGALKDSNKRLLHTSGTSIVGKRSRGELADEIFNEKTPFEPSPARVERVAINQLVLDSARNGIQAIVIAPSLIYGAGRGVNRDSMQVPWLIRLAKEKGVALHIGPGANVWSNVHIDDLVQLYLLAITHAPAGSFYFAENGENSMREVCEAISRTLGYGGNARSMTVDEACAAWGEGPANDTMGSNSRVRALRARAELGWQPAAGDLIAEIERGCYAQDA